MHSKTHAFLLHVEFGPGYYQGMYYYVLLCITVYYHVFLCITMYYYVLLCISMYHYVLLCIPTWYILLCIPVHCYAVPGMYYCVVMYYYVLQPGVHIAASNVML